MPNQSPKPRKRQAADAPPVIEDRRLARMGEAAPPRGSARKALMADEPRPDEGKRNRMKPFPRGQREPKPSDRPMADQEAPAQGKASPRDGYLRLRVRVEDGEMAVVGGKVVPGPLVQSEVLHPGMSYEVLRGARRVAYGDVPDAGEWRSFADPEGRAAMQGHHITRVASYEIAVRIPLEELSAADFGRLRVVLYRWQGAAPVPLKATGALKKVAGRGLTEVASLESLRLDTLPREVQSEIRRAIRK
jgi:hypothetical protein